jgi:hypothetical protein
MRVENEHVKQTAQEAGQRRNDAAASGASRLIAGLKPRVIPVTMIL